MQGTFFDLLSLAQNLLISAKIYICRGQIIQRFVIALMIVVVHKTSDLLLKLPGIEIVLQLDHVLHRTMIALDLTLGHGMIGRTAYVLDMLALQKGFEFSGNITGTVIGQQSRAVLHQDMLQAGPIQSYLQGVLNIQGGHSVGQLESQNEAGIIIQNGGQVIPTPPRDLEISEVGLPQLIHSCGRVLEGVRGFDHCEGWTFDQVVTLQDAIHA